MGYGAELWSYTNDNNNTHDWNNDNPMKGIFRL